jgi:hypothetical protein
VGLLCLAGSAAAWIALPANRYDPLAEGELVEVGTALHGLQLSPEEARP